MQCDLCIQIHVLSVIDMFHMTNVSNAAVDVANHANVVDISIVTDISSY